MVWLILLFFPAVIILMLFVLRFLASKSEGHSSFQLTQPANWEFKNVYIKKQYLFDKSSEFYFFKILQELFGDQYYVFPQIHLSHLAQVRGGNNYGGQKYLTRINKKSVDYILCDKVNVIPRLAIELDGSSHQRPDRIERDQFVDNLMKDIDLPIVHIQAGTTDKLTIKNAILNKLSGR